MKIKKKKKQEISGQNIRIQFVLPTRSNVSLKELKRKKEKKIHKNRMHRIPLKPTQMRRLNPNNSNSNIDEVAWNGNCFVVVLDDDVVHM